MDTMRVSRRALLAGAAAGCAATAFEMPAFAAKKVEAPFGFKFYGQSGQLLRAPNGFAVPSYQMTYFTSHQSTAQADIGVRSRLTATLIGITDQQLRGLTDAAYADLKAQLAAAGLPVIAQDQVSAAMLEGGTKFAPGNAEVKDIRGGISIGGSVRKAYIAMGAKEAPMIEGLHRATATGVGGMLSGFGVQKDLATPAKKLNAVLLMPSLVIDFADSDAKNGRDFLGRKRAMVNTDLGFTVTMRSVINLHTAMNKGYASSGGAMFLGKDYRVDTPFAAVGTKDSLSAVGQAYSSYLPEESERGTLIAVDAPAWEGLVRQAYTAYNAALVAEVVKAQKK